MVRRTNNNIDKTLDKISRSKETPKSAFILLMLLYGISMFLTMRTASAQGTVNFAGTEVNYSAFTGVFSALGNICIITLVIQFRRVGYIVSLILLVLQFPMMFISVFVRGNMGAISGFFSNILILGAVSIIYFSYRKILRYQHSVREQAITDRLTGLPNRFASCELMQDLIRRNERFAIVSIDLNDFKSINDTMGHDIGDKVRIEVARRWKELANSLTTDTIDFIARNTGDEYLLVISEFASEEDVEKTIDAYKTELEKKLTIDDFDLYLTACFGYSMCPEDSAVIDSVLLYADAALHEAKKTGNGSRVLKFTQDILNTERSLEIERKIRAALEEDKIFFHLQPQYDMNHRLRGFEALARMKDNDGSYISPVDFIPVAEKTGLVDRIDMCVFRKAMDFLDSISDYDSGVMLSVNVSVKHLMKNNFIEEVKNIIDTHNVAPERIEIEITESIMIDSAEKALERIDEVKSLGMKIAIDDFGTGYSSLSYLNSFPSDLLKIDKAFIDMMDQNDSSKKYVSMIISIGHVLDLKVISEGVESPEQIVVLKKIGCDYIQGFVWGKPMPPEEAEQLVVENKKEEATAY